MRSAPKTLCLALLVASLVVGPRAAFSATDTKAPAASSDEGFGAQVLVVDIAAALAGGAFSYATRSALPFIVIFGAGAPSVHLAHHDKRGAGASLALNLGLPLLAEIVASQAICGSYSGEDQFTCEKLATPLSGLAGALPAMIIDAASLSHPPPSARMAAIAPLVTASRDGHFGIAFAGRF